MDSVALLIAVGWLILTALFGYGWLRGGNGHWRWRQHRDDVAEDAPLYGVMALVFLEQAVFFVLAAAGVQLNRNHSRLWQTAPLFALFTLAAAVGRPWGRQ